MLIINNLHYFLYIINNSKINKYFNNEFQSMG